MWYMKYIQFHFCEITLYTAHEAIILIQRAPRRSSVPIIFPLELQGYWDISKFVFYFLQSDWFIALASKYVVCLLFSCALQLLYLPFLFQRAVSWDSAPSSMRQAVPRFSQKPQRQVRFSSVPLLSPSSGPLIILITPIHWMREPHIVLSVSCLSSLDMLLFAYFEIQLKKKVSIMLFMLHHLTWLWLLPPFLTCQNFIPIVYKNLAPLNFAGFSLASELASSLPHSHSAVILLPLSCVCVSCRSAHSLPLQFCNFCSYVSQGSAHSRFIQSWARDSGAPGGQRDGERFWLGWLWQGKKAWKMTAALASHFHSLSLASPSICFLVIISSLRISNPVDFLELCSFVSSDLLLLLSSANFPFRVLWCFSVLPCTQTQHNLPNKWKVRQMGRKIWSGYTRKIKMTIR